MTKSLKEISWDVSEEVYRADSALSYSTLAKFKRTGFNGLDHLFDKTESPSLTFGSAVDAIITGGKEEFDAKFMVADFPSVSDSILPIVKDLFTNFHNIHDSLNDMPDEAIINIARNYSFRNNWKPETRARVIKEEGSEYYKLMYLAKDRTILDTATHQDVINCVDALRTSEATHWHFAVDNPFDNVERYYQLKFKATLNNVAYRCMADEIIVDHVNKLIIPVDLKTSSKPEWDFYKSFIEWDYQIQARLYWRIIRANLDKDEYFKDFKLLDYNFIVVNRKTLHPLVWICPFTQSFGTLKFGKREQIEFPDPEELGKELYYYLHNRPNAPFDIRDQNNIEDWLNKL